MSDDMLKPSRELINAAEEYVYNPGTPTCQSGIRGEQSSDPEQAFIAGAQWQQKVSATSNLPSLPDGELKGLLEKATALPWGSDLDAIPYSPRQKSSFAAQGAGIESRPSGEHSVEVIVGGSQDEQGGAVGVLRNEDAALIVAAVNALPRLLAKQEVMREAIESALDITSDLLVGLDPRKSREEVQRTDDMLRAALNDTGER